MLSKHTRSLIYDVPDWPVKGITFKDITPLLTDPIAFAEAIEKMITPFLHDKIDFVVAPESRGFIFGAPIALALKAGFIPARKPNKLPRKSFSHKYGLEYGKDELAIHADALRPGARVLVVDDVLATGGTIGAVAELVKQCGGEIVGWSFLLKIKGLHPALTHPRLYWVDEV